MQAFMRQFTVRQRMSGAIAVVLALLGAVGGAGLWGMWRLSHVATEFTERAYQETLVLSQLKASMGAMTRHEKDMIIAYEKPEAVKAAHTKWLASHDKAKKIAGKFLEGGEDADNVVVRNPGATLAGVSSLIAPLP